MDRDDDDFGEGFIAESHPLRPTGLSVPGRDSRAPSISSSITDMDVPIYTRETTIPYPKAGLNGKLAFAIIAAALGSAFQHGYNTGVVNAPQSIMEQWLNETIGSRGPEFPSKAKIKSIWGIAVGITCVGGMIGGALVGSIANKFGRRGGLLLNNIFVLLTVIFEGFSKSAGSYEMFIFGRLLIGVNSGLNAGLTPMYLAEISPINLRGAVGTVYQLVITISILIAQFLGMESMLGTESGWPTLFVITIVPAIFQCITLPFCPETPKFLMFSKDKQMDAQKALVWLRGTNDVHDEMDEMRTEYESVKLVPQVTLRELLMNSALRIPLIIAVMIMIAQQFSGINAIIFFSTEIFKMANLSESAAQGATLGLGLVNVLVTLLSLVLIEKAGRKTLLLIGFGGDFIVTILITLAMTFAKDSQFAAYSSVFLVIMFIVFFAIGPGSIPWFLVSELFNQSARPTATSVAIAVNWTANFIIGTGFLPVAQAMGSYVFLIFATLLGLFTLFIYKKVPETKNKTLEEISSMFRQISYQ